MLETTTEMLYGLVSLLLLSSALPQEPQSRRGFNGPTGKLSHLANSETPSPTTAAPITFTPVAPTKTPSFSPTGFPTLSPTANRLNMTIERLTNVSGAEVFRDVTSPQYRAALYVADQDELMFPVDHPRLLQRYLLAVFYFAMDGDNWVRCGRLDVICGGDPDDRSWLVGRNDECTWQGVDCDASGVVRRLFFARQLGNGLSGEFPFELSLMTNMDSIILQSNAIRGTLPSFLGALTKLRLLILPNNELTGTIPRGLLTGASQLTNLNLAGNNFTGTIPTEITQLDLTELRLRDNSLVGTVPSGFGSLTQLRRVALDENGLTGPLPVDLLRNPTAQRVRLHGNHFTGEIPTNVGQMSSLEDLVLSSNALRGTLPTELFRLPDLVQLAVDTCGMSGTLSEDFARWNRTMRNLILSNNKFTGPIPQAFDHLTTLNTLLLHGNALTGTISTTLCTEKGNFFFDLRNLTAPPSVSCTCCDLQQ